MKCEKCSKELSTILVNRFNYDGSDSLVDHYYEEVEENAVVIETDQAWTGNELSEEEMIETIECPHCHCFPFKDKEIQIYDIVRIVMFKDAEDKPNE